MTSSTMSPPVDPTRVGLIAVVHGHLRRARAVRAPLGRAWPGCLFPYRRRLAARAEKASDAVVAVLAGLVGAMQAPRAGDLVSELVSARDGGGRLSTQELPSAIFQLIVAGCDAAASLLGNDVVALLRNPVPLARLRSDPGKTGGGHRGAPAPRRARSAPGFPLRDRTGKDR